MATERRVWLMVITGGIAAAAALIPWLETSEVEPVRTRVSAASWSDEGYVRLRRQTYKLAMDERWDDVIRNGERLVKWREDDSDVWRWLGTGYQVQGDYSRAVMAWEQATNFSNLRNHSLVRLASARMMVGDRSGALSALEQAREAGYRDGEVLLEDQGLMGLRSEPRFQELVASMEYGEIRFQTAHDSFP